MARIDHYGCLAVAEAIKDSGDLVIGDGFADTDWRGRRIAHDRIMGDQDLVKGIGFIAIIIVLEIAVATEIQEYPRTRFRLGDKPVINMGQDGIPGWQPCWSRSVQYQAGNPSPR